jgi:hypothetical protein
MDKWEFTIVTTVLDNWMRRINDLGKEGWELVSVENETMYFKRKIINDLNEEDSN